jgi:hypothetical protein
MGFTEILTILFVALKLFGVINWSWWLVCLPEIIALAVYLIVWICALGSINRTHKTIRKHFDDFDL